MWVNPSTKKVHGLHSDIRAAFPDVSMPPSLNEEVISSLGLKPLILTERPTGYIVEHAEPLLINGEWVQQWKVRPPEQYETDAEAERVRNERNRLLTASDWTQVKDAPVDQDAWGVYRQTLRDITLQPGFPWEINWPVAP